MRKKLKKTFTFLMAIVVLFSLCYSAFAHSGRTDSSGGHRDNKNKSGLGSYHYHCGGYPAHLHTYGYCPYRDVFPKSVKVSAEKTSLRIGESINVYATVSPSNACDTSVDWECSNPDVISFRNGVAEAVGFGTATLTASSFNNKVGKIKITVKEVTAKSVTIQEPSEPLYPFNEYSLTCSINPSYVDNPEITWASSDETVATVSSTGCLNTTGVGTVTISAAAANGVIGRLTLQVMEKVVEAIDIPETNMLIYLCESTKIPVNLTPEDATYPDVTWNSSDESVISIDEAGVATAVGNGTAIVTASSVNGLTDSINIKVDEIIAERIEISGNDTVQVGHSTKLKVNYYPKNTSVKTIEWFSSDESILSVDSDGIVHAHQLGTATVTAIQKDSKASKEIEVVPIPVDSVKIIATLPNEVISGQTIHFKAKVRPKDATYPEVEWSSSNPLSGTINANGEFTARLFGTTTITASTKDGAADTYEVEVTASDEVSVLLTMGTCGASAAGYFAYKKRKKLE